MGLHATVEFRKIKTESGKALGKPDDKGIRKEETYDKHTLFIDDGTGEAVEVKVRDPLPFQIIPKGTMIEVELHFKDVAVRMSDGNGTYQATSVSHVTLVNRPVSQTDKK